MRFIKFPVSSTNIFPLANSTAGGQLLSEWNLRSRETVGTNPNVKYEIGPSFTHSEDDFKISQSVDNTNQVVTGEDSLLVISEGRAIINGHFIESLAPITIDLLEANAQLQLNDRAPLKGQLAVGLRALYSTYQTMAGSMIPEKKSAADESDDEIDDTSTEMYYGVQVVILPVSEMLLPEDEPTNEDNIQAHLLLGTFEYAQGKVYNVVPNKERIKYIDGERIHNIDELLSQEYVSKYGLMPDRMYVMSGKARTQSNSENPWKDTWCDATNSLVNWAKQMPVVETKPTLKSAQFLVDDDATVSLHLAHKQVDGMTLTKQVNGEPVSVPAYYADTVLPIPAADYGANTPGVVTRAYTENLKLLASKLANVFQYSKGKQVAYKESLTSKDELPRINSAWNVGDYVLVKSDYSSEIGGDNSSYPSTMYAVIPGYITGISYFGSVDDSDEVPKALTGVELQSINIDEIPVTPASIAGEELALYRFSNIPIYGESAQLILSGSMVHTVETSNLYVDESPNAAESDSFTIETAPYQVSSTLTELHSSNSEFASHYEDYSSSTVTFTPTSVTIHRLPGMSWKQCGVELGDTVIVVFDKTADKDSKVLSTTTMQLQSGVDFNPITGNITSESAIEAIRAVSAKGVYNYYKLTNTDLFSDFKTFRGEPNKDYFVAIRTWKDPNDENISHKTRYYFMISSSMPYEWSDAITITGRVYLAEESSIGGFYNISSDKTDAGYVYLDSDGHLRLRDYALLRSGTLAYQLGEDIEEFGSGEDIETIQETLDEYINDRIAFPSEEQRQKSSTPTVIHVTINLTDAKPSTDTDTGTRNLFIRNIDSRFGTSVHFHFNGDATNKTIINFVDCEKIRIDSNICGTTMNNASATGPIINVYRCGLYYDPAVMNYIATCERLYDTDFSVYDYENDVFYTDNYPSWFTGMQDIKLWYQAYEDTDPRLTVDDMTVSDMDVAMVAEDIDYWTPKAPQDNHFSVALSSLTFAKDGTIIRCGLLVADTSTTNITGVGEYLVLGKFTLPSGSGLLFPKGCLTKRLKVSGSFTTAYLSDPSHNTWHISDTNFTAITENYDRYTGEASVELSGSISFHEKVSVLTVNLGDDVSEMKPFSPDKYHLFTGGICW